jgi:hypothetical protein
MLLLLSGRGVRPLSRSLPPRLYTTFPSGAFGEAAFSLPEPLRYNPER